MCLKGKKSSCKNIHIWYIFFFFVNNEIWIVSAKGKLGYAPEKASNWCGVNTCFHGCESKIIKKKWKRQI